MSKGVKPASGCTVEGLVVCSGVGDDGCNPNCKHAKPHEPFCESDDVDPCSHYAGCGCIGEDVICTRNARLDGQEKA